ncbi:MAG TPA: hypothetical protein VM369_01800 [Candidatus Binatia bacterium]|nr:hypothetical protein [Candidatus Binatia bacterium]
MRVPDFRKLRSRLALACGFAAALAAAAPAWGSISLASGSLYRSAGVPPWTADDATFTVMLWVYGPKIRGDADYFEADDSVALHTVVNLGSAADSPTDPYFLTRNGEWHFNKDGTFVANPLESFDVSQDWTFLAVSFTTGGATDLYAWQAGVNAGQLVHIPVQSSGSALGGTGTVRNFFVGSESGFRYRCQCLLGPLYVYDGVALSQGEVDAQRQQLEPVVSTNLIAYSNFASGGGLSQDLSGTATWQRHGTPTFNPSNPPVMPQGVVEPGKGDGGGGGFGVPALALFGLLGLRRAHKKAR